MARQQPVEHAFADQGVSQLDRGVSVSIDGRIYTESLFQPVTAANEVVLVAKLRGG